MKHVSYCSVANCCISTNDYVPFFRCPKDPVMCQKWKESLGFVGNHKYAELTPLQCNNRIKVCSDHFDDNCFTQSGKRLLPSAIPVMVRKKSFEGPSNVANSYASTSTQAELCLTDASTQTDDVQPLTDCKIRWKSLKDVYRKRKKEMSDGVTKRHCKWEHMDSLNFLEGVMSSKSTPATPKPKKNEPSDRPDLVNIQMLRDANEEEEEETEVEESEIKIEMDEMDVEEAALLSINKEESDREMNGAATHSTNSHVEEPDQESSAAARHPLQIFFDSMACTAMSFPPPLAVRAKTGVLEVISKLELEMWNQSE